MQKNEKENYRPPLAWRDTRGVAEIRVLRSPDVDMEEVCRLVKVELEKGNVVVVGLVDEL